MRKQPLPTKRTFLALAAALALALTGAACSGENGGGRDAATDGQEERAAAGAERPQAADAAPAGLATAEFDVEGMTCGGCALATEMAVKKLDGVASADAQYDEATGEGRCTVEYDPDRVTTDQIAAAIEEAGFTPALASGSSGS